MLYLLGLLNSSMLVNCWLKNKAMIITSTSSIYATSLIPLTTPKQQEEIAQLVRIIMDKTHDGKDSVTKQQKVSQIVPTLYI